MQELEHSRALLPCSLPLQRRSLPLLLRCLLTLLLHSRPLVEAVECKPARPLPHVPPLELCLVRKLTVATTEAPKRSGPLACQPMPLRLNLLKPVAPAARALTL